MLYLNGESTLFIVIEISRVDISVGIVDLCGSIICEEAFKICESDIAFEKIKTIIDNKCEKLIELSAGRVDSKVLIASSLAIHNYFEE